MTDIDVDINVQSTEEDGIMFVLKEGYFCAIVDLEVNGQTQTTHIPVYEVE